MKRLIKRILREHKEFKNKLFNLLNSGQDENIDMVKYLSEGQGYDLRDILIEYFQEYGPPYFNIFNVLEIPEEEQEYILTKIYGNISIVKTGLRAYIYDDNDNEIYEEYSDGFWLKLEYDDKGNKVYEERSNGYWEIQKYDDKGREIYFEHSDGYWRKREWGYNGYRIYYENSNGDIDDRR